MNNITRSITSWTRYIHPNKVKNMMTYEDHRHILKTFDARWNGDMDKKEFKLLTDSYKGNIDSHDNSLYHESLYKKENNYKFKNHYTKQSLVDDYNKRWNKNITVEDYYKNFK